MRAGTPVRATDANGRASEPPPPSCRSAASPATRTRPRRSGTAGTAGDADGDRGQRHTREDRGAEQSNLEVARAVVCKYRAQDDGSETVEERADGLDPQDDPEVALDVQGRHGPGLLTAPRRPTSRTTVRPPGCRARSPGSRPR